MHLILILKRDQRKNSNSDSSPRINLDNLYHISGGDEQFVKQMLESFVSTTDKGLKDMQEAMLSHHDDQVADLAHKLLAPCRHIGVSVLCILLKRIEESIQNNFDRELIVTMIVESVAEFNVVRELINEHTAKIE